MTETEIFDLLPSVFKSPAFICIPQVRSQVGYGEVRTADALVASVWPSRGLYLIGVEIKVARGDWHKELKNPDKAERIARFCKHWYMAAPEGIIKPGELPATWGLLEAANGKLKISTPPAALETQPPTMRFLCAILRAAQRSDPTASELREAENKGWEEGREYAKEQFENRRKCLDDKIIGLESELLAIRNEFNIDAWDHTRTARIFRAFKEIENRNGLLSFVEDAERRSAVISAAATEIRRALGDGLGV